VIDVVASWGAPLAVLLAAAIGAGELVGQAARRRLATSLLLPVGLAALVVAAAWSVWLGVPVVAVALAGGLLALLGARTAWARRDAARAGVLAVAAVMLAYAAPFLVSGQPTVGAYTSLADPAIHLVGADGLFGGASASAMQPGAFRAFYDGYFENGYPTGGAALLGALSHGLGADPLHALMPLMLVALAALSAALWHLAAPLVPNERLRGIVAALPAAPALVATFATNGSQKELLAVALLATTAAALRAPLAAFDDDLRPRDLLVACVPAAATLAAIGLAAGIYLAPLALLVGASLLRAPRRAAWVAGVGVLLTVVLAAPTLAIARRYVDVSGGSLTSAVELGNLIWPLPTDLVLGIWIGPDIRLPAAHQLPTHLAAACVALLALLGWGAAARRIRESAIVPVLAWGLAIAAGSVLAIRAGSPWADAKALTIASPVVMFGAALGAVVGLGAGRRAVRLAVVGVGAVAAAGLGLTAILIAYNLAPLPADRYAELATVDARFAGQGPMGVGEFEEYGRHVLRDVPIRFAHDPYARLGSAGSFGVSADQDELDPAEVQALRLLLVRRGPQGSRPPSNFERVWRGRWYEVWRRTAAPAPRIHLALGGWSTGGLATPTCQEIEQLAASAQPGEQLVAAVRPVVAVGSTTGAVRPTGWLVDRSDPTVLLPREGGRITVPLKLGPAAAGQRIAVWWDVSTLRAVHVRAGGVTATVPPVTLNQRHSATHVLDARADASGRLVISLAPAGARPRPAWGNIADRWGQLFAVVASGPREPQLVRVPAAQAERLCGRPLDWLELVPSAPGQSPGARPDQAK
jgi:hypothetical protein